MKTSLPGSLNGSDFSRKPFTALNTVVLTPKPKAKVMTINRLTRRSWVSFFTETRILLPC